MDLVAVSYRSSNAESLVQTWRGSLPASGDDSLARFLLVRGIVQVTGLVGIQW